MRTYLASLILAAATVLGGCSGCGRTDATEGEAGQVELTLRTGEGCEAGCSLDRPLLVGTEERIELRAEVEPDRLRVRSSDPETLAAWLERTTLCCTGGRCIPVTHSSVCEGQPEQLRMIVVRALTPGRVALEIETSDGQLYDRAGMTVARAADLVVTPAMSPVDDLRDVVTPPDVPEAAGAPMMDGQLTSLETRVGMLTPLRIEARTAEGDLMQASRGMHLSITDPTRARLLGRGDDLAGIGRAHLAGSFVYLKPLAPGETTLEVVAEGASTTLAIRSMPPCVPLEPDVVWSDAACESDSDCAPAECCHAATCGAASEAPDCGGEVCTLECRTGTVDCEGRCLCLQGRCAAYRLAGEDPSCAPPGTPSFDLPLPPRLQP